MKTTHVGMLDSAVSIIDELESNKYCEVMAKVEGFNLTFCQTIDNSISRDQGFRI
jgi:hypothetical protein